MATVPSWQLRQSFESPSGGFWGDESSVLHSSIELDGRIYDACDSVWFQSGVAAAP